MYPQLSPKARELYIKLVDFVEQVCERKKGGSIDSDD
jgi:hypothetical protein